MYTPPESDKSDASSPVVFSEMKMKVLELGARFRREADAHYVDQTQVS